MSDHDEERPLTRRERRLQEMVETGALDLSEALAQAKEPVAPAEGSEAPASDEAGQAVADAVEISPFHEDGTPRSRREMRELRAAAEAGEAADVSGSEGSPQLDESSESAAHTAEEAPVAEPSDEVPAEHGEEQIASADPALDLFAPKSATSPSLTVAPALDFDTLITPPTEAFSVEDIRDAERGASASAADGIEAEEPTNLGEDADEVAEVVEVAEVTEVAEVAEAAPQKQKRRFPWSRNKADDASVELDEQPAVEEGSSEPVGSDSLAGSDAHVADSQPAEVEAADLEAADAVAPGAEAEAVEVLSTEVAEAESDIAESVTAEATPAESADEPASDATLAAETPTEAYSFPDIVPPEEWRSVFDDPASRQVNAGAGAQAGDFDDLISRAVAQEGAAAASNTSALILPTMPDDTGGLAGPLGATGELFVTGSFDLPRSLGETGGHSTLHDSLKFEPFEFPDAPAAGETGDSSLAPVSAKSAVSARMPSGIPVVAKPTKEQSKLPLILGLSGGGLLVVVVGLGIWGVSSGLFSG